MKFRFCSEVILTGEEEPTQFCRGILERPRGSMHLSRHLRFVFIFAHGSEHLWRHSLWQFLRGFSFGELSAIILTFGKGPFDRVGLRMTVSLRNRNGRVPGDSRQREGVDAGLGQSRQRRVAQSVNRKRSDFGNLQGAAVWSLAGTLYDVSRFCLRRKYPILGRMVLFLESALENFTNRRNHWQHSTSCSRLSFDDLNQSSFAVQ